MSSSACFIAQVPTQSQSANTFITEVFTLLICSGISNHTVLYGKAVSLIPYYPYYAFPEQSSGDESKKNMDQTKFLAARHSICVFLGEVGFLPK